VIASDAKWLDENDVEIFMQAPCVVTDPAAENTGVHLSAARRQ
jgi:hypothetical protein